MEQLNNEMKTYVDKKMEELNSIKIAEEKSKFQFDEKEIITKKENVSGKRDSLKVQMITLEATIFGALVVFQQGSNGYTAWLGVVLICLVISVIFGIWSLFDSIEMQFFALDFMHKLRVEHNWFLRTLWKDPLLEEEKKLSKLVYDDIFKDQQKTSSFQKIKNKLNLDAIFFGSFYFALFFLLIHFGVKANAIPFFSFNIKLPHAAFNLKNIDFGLLTPTFGLIQSVGVLIAAYLTKKTIDEMRRQNSPHVIINLKQRPGDIHTIFLSISNEGKSAARNLKFSTEGGFKVISGQTVSDIPFIKNGLGVLAAGQEITYPLGLALGDQYSEFMKSKCTISASYVGEANALFSESFQLDFGSLTDIQLGEQWTDKINKNLEKIVSEMGSFRRTFVDVQPPNTILPPQAYFVPEGSNTHEVTGKISPVTPPTQKKL